MANLHTERAAEKRQIATRLKEIWDTVYTDRAPIGAIESVVTGQGKGPGRMPQEGWKPYKLFEQWGGFDQTTWFRMRAAIPKSMDGRKVVAFIRPGGEPVRRPDGQAAGEASPCMPGQGGMSAEAGGVQSGTPALLQGGLTLSGALADGALAARPEALAYINGKPAQGLDRNRDELLLTDKARAGEKFDIVLEAVPSTSMDVYHCLQYADIAAFNEQAWSFYWDVKVNLSVVEALGDNYAPARQLLELMRQSLWMVDLQRKGEPAYFASIEKAQRFLRQGLKEFEHSRGMGALTLVGHAHIDTAWLWPVRETKRKCSRTFSTVLRYMEQYPEYHFSCSQPVQYDWMKTHYPEIYKDIKKRVKEGRWEACGAPWVEPDCNVPSGESLVRQFLLGNRFYRQEFGLHSRTAWLPDAFGYCWSLPQIMRKAQVDAFVTTKIDWSAYTQHPYNYFLWEGPDGTSIRAVMPPLSYNGTPAPKDLIAQWDQFKQKEKVNELPFCFGWGDGGGGPTWEMLEHGKRLGNVMGVPRCSFGRVQDCVDRMAEQCAAEALPVWNGELYLELHRGCQTSQARTKRNNRKCEMALRDAEWLSALSLIHKGPYGRKELEDAWKLVLTNQFHDILPGSSINEVYVQADADYAETREHIASARDKALNHLLKRIDARGGGVPVVVFNSLSWSRTDAAEVTAPLPDEGFEVRNQNGDPVLHQVIGENRLLILAEDVPPLGYAVYHIVPDPTAVPEGAVMDATARKLENDFVRVRIDKNGRLTSVYDKFARREALETGQRGNVLQFFDDRPYEHDAWDIDHNFEEIMWEAPAPERIEVAEAGPIRSVVRVVWRTEKGSVITQDITLHVQSARVDFVTHVDWKDKRTLLKAAFPVAVRSARAAYEIQYATVERATHRNTPFDRARFEVPAQKWADLSEGDYGVSLLNDCKYGYDVKDNVLRLSLLRSPIEPDPHADEGEHFFTYALYPHEGDWRWGAVQEGYELNVPLLAYEGVASKGSLPPVYAFAAVDQPNVIIDAVKRCEDSDDVIVRLYEAYGQRGVCKLTFGGEPKAVTECDLMEENDAEVNLKGHTVRFQVKPYEIRTFKVRF